MSDSKAQISALSLAEQREQDRKRYSDPAFNRWLDEGISDSGHTVWDAIGDTGAAWAGWQNRPHYDAPAGPQGEQQPVAWRYRTDENPSRWHLSCMTPREADEWNSIIEAQPLYATPQPAPDALREAARMALEAIRRLTASEDITYLRGSVALALVEAEDALVDALREALGDEK